MSKKRILIPVDTSDHSMKSVEYVAAVFSASHTEVVLFHVYSQIEDFFSSLDISLDSHNVKMNDLLKKHQQAINTFMEKARSILKTHGFSDTDITIKIKSLQMQGIAEEIHSESKYHYNAVVVGRTGISQLNEFIGNTAASLIDLVNHIPIIIVDNVPKSNKLLIAYDGSENADRAVQSVGDLLADTTYDALFYNVVKSLKYSLVGIIEILASKKFETEYYQKQREAILEKIEKASASLIKNGFGNGQLSKEIELEVKSRAHSILKKSTKDEYSTIVVGRSGKKVANTLGIGTVGRKITGMANNRTIWIVN
jgi:nucleotide-binding universal stress UspA family protein